MFKDKTFGPVWLGLGALLLAIALMAGFLSEMRMSAPVEAPVKLNKVDKATTDALEARTDQPTP